MDTSSIRRSIGRLRGGIDADDERILLVRRLAVRSRGEPLFQGFCQCLDCRKVGCGHYAAIGMPEHAVTVIGEYRSYGKKGG